MSLPPRRWLRPMPLINPAIGTMKQYVIYRVTLRADGLAGVIDRASDRVFITKGDATEIARNLQARTGHVHVVLEWKPEERPK